MSGKWDDFGAITQAEYEERRVRLKNILSRAQDELEKIASLEGFRQYLITLNSKCDFYELVQVKKGFKKLNAPYVEKLKTYDYPEAFIQWHEAFGENCFRIKQLQILDTREVIQNQESSRYSLLTANGYVILTDSPNGTFYACHPQNSGNTIVFSNRYEIYTSSDEISYIYDFYYDFTTDDEGGYENPENLDLDLIYEGEDYKIDSPYIRKYLDHMLQDTEAETYIEFVKGLIQHEFGLIEEYHELNSIDGKQLECPEDLVTFLESDPVLYYESTNIEKAKVRFKRPEELKEKLYPVSTQEAKLVIDGELVIGLPSDPHKNDSGVYFVPAVSLLSVFRVDDEFNDVEGLLLYVPSQSSYGLWIESTNVMKLFPNSVTWTEIEKRFSEFLGENWSDLPERAGIFAPYIYDYQFVNGYHDEPIAVFPSEQTQYYYFEAVKFEQKEAYGVAVACYEEAIKYGADFRVYYEGGQVYKDNFSDYEKAYEYYANAESLTKTNHDKEILAEEFYYIGRHHFDDDRHEKAIECFMRALSIAPGGKFYFEEETYYHKGLSLYHLNDYEKALENIIKATEIVPENMGYKYSQAYVLLKLGRQEESLELFEQVIQAKPTVFNYENRAIVYKQIGAYEKALADYTEAIKLSEDVKRTSELYVLRSGIHKLMGNTENVLLDLKAAIDEDTHNMAAYMDTIELYITTNDCAGGFEYLQDYEDIILELGERRQKLVYLYLKALIYIALEKDYSDFKGTIKDIAKEGLDLSWYFGHTNKWAEEADFSEKTKAEIRQLTNIVQNIA